MVSSISNVNDVSADSKDGKKSSTPNSARTNIYRSVKIENDNSILIDEFLNGVDPEKLERLKGKTTHGGLSLMESERSGDGVFESRTDKKKKTQSVLQIKKGSSDDTSIVSFKDMKNSGKKSKAGNNDKMKKYHELLKKENSRQQNKFERNKKTI